MSEQTIQATVDAILAAPYIRVLRRSEDGFAAEVLEFPGCFSAGATDAEAATNLEEAMALWVETELEQGHDIPKPLEAGDFSGRLTLRILPMVHERAAFYAAAQQVSLNRFLAAAISQYVGEQEAKAQHVAMLGANVLSAYAVPKERRREPQR